MDFSKTNIPRILQSALKCRFQDFSPQDFEDFIAQLYRDSGCEVQQTPYSGDYGADLIVTTKGTRTAIQIKRYAPANNVGVPDLNQVIGARSFYDCQRARVITTSGFSEQAKSMAVKANIDLTDWEHLLSVISKVYLNGLDIYDYFKNEPPPNTPSCPLEIRIKDVRVAEQMKGGKESTIIIAELTNISSDNILISLFLPTLITTKNKQVQSTAWLSDYFSSGTLYAGCTVEIAFCIDPNVILSVYYGDRIIFDWNEGIDGDHKELVFTIQENNSCSLRSIEEIEKDIMIQSYLNEGFVSMENDDHSTAIKLFTNVINTDPDNLHALEMRGLCYDMARRYEEALDDLTRALALNPYNIHLYMTRGRAFFELNRKREARADFERYLIEGDPDPEIEEMVNYYLRQCR